MSEALSREEEMLVESLKGAIASLQEKVQGLENRSSADKETQACLNLKVKKLADKAKDAEERAD